MDDKVMKKDLELKPAIWNKKKKNWTGVLMKMP
jgi:hypothetical protein